MNKVITKPFFKYFLLFISSLCCHLGLVAQDLILDTQAGIEVRSSNLTSPVRNKISKQRSALKIQTPFQFVKHNARERGELFLDLDTKICHNLLQARFNQLEIAVPVDESHEIVLQLSKREILAPGFFVETSSGQKDFSIANQMVFYQGIVKNHEKGMVTVTVYEDDMSIFIHDSRGKYTLGKHKKNNHYVFYNEKTKGPERLRNCMVNDDGILSTSPPSKKHQAFGRSNTCPVYLYLEVDYESYNYYNGNVNNITTYVVSLFNGVVQIYDDINVPLKLSGIKVWDTPDPFGDYDRTTGYVPPTDSVQVYLNKFRSHLNATGFKGTLAHLIAIYSSGFGGLATLDALCSSSPYGINGLDDNYSGNYPSYDASIDILAHELGHNFGSRHTRACVWGPNNDTAIDNCGDQEDGPCSSTTDITQNPGYVGTIMSACPVTALNFHPEPTNVIVSNYQAALTNCINDYYCNLYVDADGDGFGSNVLWNYGDTGESVFNNLDNNDSDANINPTTIEICGNNIDDNANGVIDEKTLALTFDSSNDEVSLGNSLGNFGTGDFTIEGKIKTSSKDKMLLSKRAVCNLGSFWNIKVNANGKLNMEIGRSTNSAGYNSTTDIADGNWHHFAVTRVSGALKIYIDGVLETTSPNNLDWDLNNSADLYIGTSICGTQLNYIGAIDELRFWDVGRSLNLISTFKDAFLPTNTTGLIAYYDFNNNNATGGENNAGQTTLADRIGTYDGTLSGFLLSGTMSNWIDNPSCTVDTTSTDTTTAKIEDYVVPAGVTELTFEAKGADGGRITSGGVIAGGTGGTVTATFSVTPGDVIRFIVGEGGIRAVNGGAGGGGATAIINCGNSAGNCNAGNGTLLMVAGGGGGAGLQVGLGATTTLGDGNGGLADFLAGGGGGIKTAGGDEEVGGAAGSQNPTFTNERNGEGFAQGGLGAAIGGNGGGGGGYTGGNSSTVTTRGGFGGSNFISGLAYNVTNTGGADGGGTNAPANDGSAKILTETMGLPISLTINPYICGGLEDTITVTAAGATFYRYFTDVNNNGLFDNGTDINLQNSTSTTFRSSTLNAGDVVTVIASGGGSDRRAAIIVPNKGVFSRTTSGKEDYIVPAGVNELTFEARGGGGGRVNGVLGGTGGVVRAKFPVTPGDVIRFIVGERGARNSNGGGNGGGSSAIINCGNSAANCNNGTGTLLLVAGGGGGAGLLSGGGGAKVVLGNGGGGISPLNQGAGGGGINSAGADGSSSSGGAMASQNPTFTTTAFSEGFTAGGLGTGTGGNGGGGGGYTGGDGNSVGVEGGAGGSNFVASTAINVSNGAGQDAAAGPNPRDGYVCIVEQETGIGVSLVVSAATCSSDNRTFTATATGATNYNFFVDANNNGEVDTGENLQNGSSNTYVTNTLATGQALSVSVTDGVLTGRATITVPTPTDNVDPVFSNCQASYTANLNLCGEFTLDATVLGLAATDNCGAVTITFAPASVNSATTTAIVATATDEVGNTAVCNFNLTTNTNPDAFTIATMDDNLTTNQSEAITFTDADLLTNDQTTPMGVTLEVEEVTLTNPAQGTLVDNGNNSYTFIPAGGFTGNASLTYSVRVQNGASFNEANNHFYELVATPQVNWVQARDAAKLRTLAGISGYLATITSQAEQDFVFALLDKEAKATGNTFGIRAWLGASDAATEGDWRWVTGPEGEANGGQGTPFWSGDRTGSAVNGAYNNWVVQPNLGQTEPNNLITGGNTAGEDYAHTYTNEGAWNDFPIQNTLKSYVVEYGGSDGCSPTVTASANLTIDVQPDLNGANAFITTWKTTPQQPTINIFTNPTYTYNFTIDWGDGTVEMNQTGTVSHTYTDHTVFHTIKIAGTFPHFWADNNNTAPSNAHLIQSIDQWGTIAWSNFFRAFNNALFMKYNATDAPNLSNVQRLGRMFANCFGLDENVDLSNWDVSNVELFDYMFLNAFNFNGNVDNWVFTNAKDFTGMFSQARTFNRDISGWNVSGVIDMRAMFHSADKFNQNIGGWNVGNVTDMIDMFLGAKAFNQNISMWNVSSVINMRSMFREAAAFDQNISSWNVGNVRSMAGMFFKASSFNQDISGWNTSSVQNMSRMFQDATSFDQNLGGLNLTNLSISWALDHFLSNSGMSTTNYDNSLIGWAAQNVGNNFNPVGVHGLKYCAGRDARQDLIDNHGWKFVGDALDEMTCGDLPFITVWTTTSTNPDIEITTFPSTRVTYNYTVDWGDGATSSNVTGSISHTYNNHSSPHVVKISGDFPRFVVSGSGYTDRENSRQLKEVRQWGSIEWQSLFATFYLAENMELTASDAPNLSQGPSLTSIFNGAKKLNTDISDWDVSKVKKMTSVFEDAKKFNQSLNRWDVSSVTGMTAMFTRTEQFNQNLDKWKMENVQATNLMFNRATAFNQNLGIWKLNNLLSTSGSGMLSFSGMSKANYDATLLGWSGNANITSNIAIGVHGLLYCAGEAARTNLINTKGWTFIGDSKDCPSANEYNEQIATQRQAPTNNQLLATNTDFSIYPNPATYTLNITIPSKVGNSTLFIKDQLGRVIWQQQVTGQLDMQLPLDQQQFQSGMYWVSLDTGNEIITKKLIIVQ